MITVTLGTVPFQFDRVIKWLGRSLHNGHINEPVFIQYGITDISAIAAHPLVSGSSIVESERFTEIISNSRLIISHAGQGSTRNFAGRHLRFVIVPRLACYKEHIDDHQLYFAKSVSKFGVRYCLSYEEFEAILLDPPSPFRGHLFEGEKLVDHLLELYPPDPPLQRHTLEPKLSLHFSSLSQKNVSLSVRSFFSKFSH